MSILFPKIINFVHRIYYFYGKLSDVCIIYTARLFRAEMFWLKFKHFYILSYSSSQNEIKLEFIDIDGSIGLRFSKQIDLDTASQFSGDEQQKQNDWYKSLHWNHERTSKETV